MTEQEKNETEAEAVKRVIADIQKQRGLHRSGMMVDTKKDEATVPDNASHNPPSTGKPSPGAGHSRTPTEDNAKDVVKKPKDSVVKDVEG